jgi:alpha-N-arabinofuranosidase
MKIILLLLPLAVGAAAWAASGAAPVRFNWFEYTGRDAVFSEPLAQGEYRNPIFAGFYPDPSICRVGDDYYIVNSSFAYFPGIPVAHSRDLVNWARIGNAVDRPTQLNYDGLGVSRGIFAPALSHHGGTFYLVCTFVDGGGNFLITAGDPAGPWSDPVWLGFDGIDPSLFFDGDGRAWIVSNGAPPGDRPMYAGHRAIWIQEFNPEAKRPVGPREIIVNGGSDPASNPVWIEGPHIFRRDGWYYLICAEGGTAEDHSEVVFRSRSVRGPYAAGPANPILTQRTLPGSRTNPVTCTGHADFVETAGGEWWAVFLGCRPYEANYFNTGRETFMLPVAWKDGWPVILAAGTPVPFAVRGPAARPEAGPQGGTLTGNFTMRTGSENQGGISQWMMLRRPNEAWWSFGKGDGFVRLTPRRDTLSGSGNPSFICRRLQHARFEASTELVAPEKAGISAGLAVFQNERHYYYFYVSQDPAAPGLAISLERWNGDEFELTPILRPESGTGAGKGTTIGLRVTGDGGKLRFDYATSPGSWRPYGREFDATLLSTEAASGFVGSMVGLHTRIDPP